MENRDLGNASHGWRVGKLSETLSMQVLTQNMTHRSVLVMNRDSPYKMVSAVGGYRWGKYHLPEYSDLDRCGQKLLQRLNNMAVLVFLAELLPVDASCKTLTGITVQNVSFSFPKAHDCTSLTCRFPKKQTLITANMIC